MGTAPWYSRLPLQILYTAPWLYKNCTWRCNRSLSMKERTRSRSTFCSRRVSLEGRSGSTVGKSASSSG